MLAIAAAISLACASIAASAALPKPPAPKQHCTKSIVWRTLRDGTQVCPRRHSWLAGTTWIKLRWRGWGNRVTRARGYNYDFPPPQGTNGRSPLRLRLYRPQRCNDGVRIYSRVHVRIRFHYPNYHRHYHLRYKVRCNGHTTSGGEG